MEYVYIAIAIVVALALATAGLLTTRVRRRRSAPSATPPPPATPGTTGGPAAPTTAEPHAPPGPGRAAAPAPAAGPAAPPEAEAPVRPAEPAPEAPAVERPAPAGGRLARLRARLARSQSLLGRGLLALLSRDSLDEQTWEDIEDLLLSADLGVEPTQELVERLRTRLRVEGAADADGSARARSVLREELLALVGTDLPRQLATNRREGRPAVMLVVGVNGVGKTTTVGKLARVLVAEDKEVLLGAADTFRAAAVDQLATWGARVGVPTVRGAEGADPASVAFDAVKTGIEQEVDVVLVDTAGRLHTKAGLMDELGKIRRVIERQAPVGEVLLVLDATTGQNGLNQSKVFAEAVDVTGIVLTKLDGTAKGGIVVAVQQQLHVPVKLVGLGEGPDDLAPFDPAAFVDALIGEPAAA